MTAKQFLFAMRHRWWIVLASLFLVTAVAGVVTKLMPKQYTSSTSLLLDIQTDPLMATLMPALVTPSHVATQTEVITSDRVASRAVQLLGLTSGDRNIENWRKATDGRVPIEQYYSQMLLRDLVVDPGKGGSVITIQFTGSDPVFAAKVANAFAQAYIDVSVELRVGPARDNLAFFDERLKTLRADLETAQGRLSDFQRRRGIIVTGERFDQENARLSSLENALATALAESADASSRSRNAGTDVSVDVAQSPAVQSLRVQLAAAQTKLSEISATLGPNHPKRIELESQVATLKQQISDEMRRVSGTTATANRIAGQRVGELRAMLDAQKKVVLGMRAERDEAAVLLHDVETAQRAYDAVSQRRSQVSVESQGAQAGARVLSQAIAPLYPSKPNAKKNLLGGAALGIALGMLIAAGLELLDGKVRGAADLVVPEGPPVLAILGRADAGLRAGPGTGPKGPLLLGGLPSRPPLRLTMDRGPR